MGCHVQSFLAITKFQVQNIFVCKHSNCEIVFKISKSFQIKKTGLGIWGRVDYTTTILGDRVKWIIVFEKNIVENSY